MKRLLQKYYRFLRWMLTAMVFLLIIPVFLQVIARFVPFVPRYIWTEEIARFAFIWIIMLGATIAVRDGTHFSVDMIGSFKPSIEKKLHITLLIIMLVFSITFFIGGWQFAQFGKTQQSEISGLPMLAIYISWPLAGLSWVAFITEQIYDHFLKQNSID